MRDSLIFTQQEERHTVLQLGRENRIVQKTLQWLEGELRKGRYLADSQQVRQSVLQCVERTDLKVKRWALNVLAEIGMAGHLEVLDSVFPFVKDDPDLLASTVRLLFSTARQGVGIELLKKNGVEIEGLALIAGSEYSTRLRRRLVEERIPIADASAEELRAAIVLTGRGKAPEHLFLDRYKNNVALSELNQHDDPTVVKYSLWGMAEMRMGFSFLKINISQYDACEPQVRKWILRLLFSDEKALSQNIDLISHAAQDPAAEVREEAAIGLRECYVQEACGDILRWYQSESNENVRHSLLDHFGNFSNRNLLYEKIVREVYRKEQLRSSLRGRIEASVAGTELYSQLRVFEINQEAPSLFSNDNDFGGLIVPKIEMNFPNAQIGAVSGEGSIHVGSQAFNQGPTPEFISEICDLMVKVASMTGSENSRREGESLALELKKEPKKNVVERAIGWAKTVVIGTSVSADLVRAGGELIDQLDNFASMVT